MVAVRTRKSPRWLFGAVCVVFLVIWKHFATLSPPQREIVGNVSIEENPDVPDPVILPIPPSGTKEHPYFVRLTRGRPGMAFNNNNEKTTTKPKPYDRFHRGYYLVTTNAPWSVVFPGERQSHSDHASYNRQEASRSKASPEQQPREWLQTTSEQARAHACDGVATNGGPFDAGGRWNSGPTVAGGALVRTKDRPRDSRFVGFGTAADTAGRRYWVLGRYGQLVPPPPPSSGSSSRQQQQQQQQQAPLPRLWDFVTGFGWLVYNKTTRVTRASDRSSRGSHGGNATVANNPTGAVRAPRTAVGLDEHSNLLLLVVDGCQHCLHRRGLTLEELADLLVDLGAVYAINMDGGGSSTMVMPRQTPRDDDSGKTDDDSENAYATVNRPTCLDLPVPHCQRAVATVLCVSHPTTTMPTATPP